MIRAARALALAGLVIAAGVACRGPGHGYLVVTVTGGARVAGLVRYHVSLANAGMRADLDLPGDRIALDPLTFALQLEPHRAGAIEVTVDALGASDRLLAQGHTIASVLPGGTAEVTIPLAEGTGDGGFPDLSQPQGDGAGNRDGGAAADLVNADLFGVLLPPELTVISPASAPVTGGTILTLTGANFRPGAQVSIRGVPAVTTFGSSTTLKATAPPAPGAYGRAQVIVVNPDTQSTSNSTLFGYGTTTPLQFNAGAPNSGYPNAGSVAVIDLDGNPTLDLAVTFCADNSTYTFVNNGSASFVASVKITTGVCPRHVSSGDLDGDGLLDLVVTSGGADSLTIAVNAGSGSWNTTPLNTGAGPRATVIGRFDGNLTADVVTTAHDGNLFSIFGGDGMGAFSLPASTSLAGGPGPIAAADLNGDGALDLLVGLDTSIELGVLLASGGGSFISKGYALSAQPIAVAIADVNLDGKPDLISGSMQAIAVFLGTGGGNFNNVAVVTPVPTGLQALAVGDFNRDGLPDLVTVNNVTNLAAVLLGDGAGTFSSSFSVMAGSKPLAVAVADFDGDGLNDFVTVGASLIAAFLDKSQ